MRRLESTGTLDLLKKRYMGRQVVCKPLLKEKPLGYEKLSFLFAMLIFGSIMSILIVSLEYISQTYKKKQEFSSKSKEIEEEIREYLEVQGLPNQETENILGRLFQKNFKKKETDTKLNMIREDHSNFKVSCKNCPSKIPRPILRKNSI